MATAGKGPVQNAGQSRIQSNSGQPVDAQPTLGAAQLFDGAFDGPSDDRPTQFAKGIGYDPARSSKPAVEEPKTSRAELPPAAYSSNFSMPSATLPERAGTNTTGKVVQIRVNQYKVLSWPQKAVHQYDVTIGNGAEKRGLIRAAWNSSIVQSALKVVDSHWLFDGNKIAWCAAKAPKGELRLRVDFDKEKGKVPRKDKDGNIKSNETYVRIRYVGPISMDVIRLYLEKKMAFDNSVLEAITFLDHVMRQGPSEKYTVIKRSFFTKGNHRTALDESIEAMKGVYSSIRLCQPGGSTGNATGLALNVDVANGLFWTPQPLMQAVRNYVKDKGRIASYLNLRDMFAPEKNGGGMSHHFKELRKMTKLRFTVKYRGKEPTGKVYTIKSFTFSKSAGREGLNAKNVTFSQRLPDGTFKETSVYDYFLKKYDIRLEYWYLPLVETTRDGWFPMEVCTLIPDQRYNFKLNPDQTSKMIKFAVTRPKERIAAINHGVDMLKWHDDPYLAHYGIKVDTSMTVTNAMVLKNPEIQYNGSKINPGTTGKWDLRGKKFIMSNPVALKSWGIAAVAGCLDETTIKNFLKTFVQSYVGHGGNVINKTPVIYIAPRGEEISDTVTNLRTATGNQSKMEPQILLYILPGRDSFLYERCKKNNEVRYGHVSQCMASSHVMKAQPQYCSNVCMKLNAKLGGATSRIAGKDPKTPPPFFNGRPTMIIGADVSHASPGSQQASMAAITMSLDKDAMRYAAAVQTNGRRVEMISRANIDLMFVPMFSHWCKTHGTAPDHIYYFRDGVSEGQYLHVLDQEVNDIKDALSHAFPGKGVEKIKYTVIVASKRHHIRFFPREGDATSADRNGNALPGTLVERDITHPFEDDFYLCSHSAIQGTARPTHYYKLMDEANVNTNQLHAMIYQHCYQYMRSTTPVSLYPAIYYAHLASNRARAHEDIPSSSGPQSGQKFLEAQQQAAIHGARSGIAHSATSSGSGNTDVLPLLQMGLAASDSTKASIKTSMWYI